MRVHVFGIGRVARKLRRLALVVLSGQF
jgi:hypothetical protein